MYSTSESDIRTPVKPNLSPRPTVSRSAFTGGNVVRLSKSYSSIVVTVANGTTPAVALPPPADGVMLMTSDCVCPRALSPVMRAVALLMLLF